MGENTKTPEECGLADGMWIRVKGSSWVGRIHTTGGIAAFVNTSRGWRAWVLWHDEYGEVVGEQFVDVNIAIRVDGEPTWRVPDAASSVAKVRAEFHLGLRTFIDPESADTTPRAQGDLFASSPET